jgi:hypothetical protein
MRKRGADVLDFDAKHPEIVKVGSTRNVRVNRFKACEKGPFFVGDRALDIMDDDASEDEPVRPKPVEESGSSIERMYVDHVVADDSDGGTVLDSTNNRPIESRLL